MSSPLLRSLQRCPDPLASALLSACDDSTVCTLDSALGVRPRAPGAAADDDDMSRRCADPVARRYLEVADEEKGRGEEKKETAVNDANADDDDEGPETGRR